jgi:hypothetical protein
MCASVKSTPRRYAAPPLRWLIARRRLRSAVELNLLRFPALDRTVRTALQGVTVSAARPPKEPKDLSLAAREVLAALRAARCRADSRKRG